MVKERRFYDHRKGHGWAYRIALDYLQGGEKVLDLCCGSGYGCEILLEKAESYLGVDYDPTCMEWARLHHPKGTFLTADLNINLLPLEDESVNFISWIEGIEHLETVVLVMQEIKRVSMDETLMILTTPATVRKDPYHRHYYLTHKLRTLFPGHLNLGVHGWCGSRVIYWKVKD